MTKLVHDGVYTLITADEPISQGDILKNCPYLFQPTGNYRVNNDQTVDLASIEAKVGRIDYSMVLTNSCDLDNDGKVKYILLCPLVPLYTLLRIKRDNYYYNHLKDDLDEDSFIERLQGYEQHRYHLLPLSNVEGNNFETEPVFLDFGNIFVLRVNFVRRFALNDKSNEKRLTIYFSPDLTNPSDTLRLVITRYTNFLKRNIGIPGI
ncbi:MAG: hypothetical protein A4E28_02679 [Methanocella sp. PtaU1.Bin125]|nr:MAG: hypothetical protein A4E28_02679 [Methanocella sp. PtaU1.Bin125]